MTIVVDTSVLVGMRRGEGGATTDLLSSVRWHEVDEPWRRLPASWAGRGDRVTAPSTPPTWRPLRAQLLTTNVRRFPMPPGPARPC